MLFDDGYQKVDYESLSSELWSQDDKNRLPPEPTLGNVEYKLKLINPTDIRFERLVSQVRYRVNNLVPTIDFVLCLCTNTVKVKGKGARPILCLFENESNK